MNVKIDATCNNALPRAVYQCPKCRHSFEWSYLTDWNLICLDYEKCPCCRYTAPEREFLQHRFPTART